MEENKDLNKLGIAADSPVYLDVSTIIKWVIDLPQDIEIFQIGISKTRLKQDTTII